MRSRSCWALADGGTQVPSEATDFTLRAAHPLLGHSCPSSSHRAASVSPAQYMAPGRQGLQMASPHLTAAEPASQGTSSSSRPVPVALHRFLSLWRHISTTRLAEHGLTHPERRVAGVAIRAGVDNPVTSSVIITARPLGWREADRLCRFTAERAPCVRISFPRGSTADTR